MGQGAFVLPSRCAAAASRRGAVSTPADMILHNARRLWPGFALTFSVCSVLTRVRARTHPLPAATAAAVAAPAAAGRRRSLRAPARSGRWSACSRRARFPSRGTASAAIRRGWPSDARSSRTRGP